MKKRKGALALNRYKLLFKIVRELQPEHIVEIGTWAGQRAKEWMGVSNCRYTGFDLFEEANAEIDHQEMNCKPHVEMMEVAQNLEQAGLHRFQLIRGNTKETLKNADIPPFDFIFIDGGHSVETIKNDYEWAKDNISPGGVIIIDDYYHPERVGFGCNFLKNEEIKPFGAPDPVMGGGNVSLLVAAGRERLEKLRL